MERIRTLQPAHKSSKVTVTAATQAFKKLQTPAARTRLSGSDDTGASPAPGKTQRSLPKRGSQFQGDELRLRRKVAQPQFHAEGAETTDEDAEALLRVLIVSSA